MAGFAFHITRNDISPKLSKMALAAKHPAPVLRAMGTTLMSITMGTFNDVGADYRPIAWANKKDGTPSKLQKSGTLSRSFHLAVTDSRATVSNPTAYAAIHQFGSANVDAERQEKGGGKPMNIPARPFFPIEHGRLTERAAEKIKAAGERAMERQMGD